MFDDVTSNVLGFEKVPIQKSQKCDASTLTVQDRHKEKCIQIGPTLVNTFCQTESNHSAQLEGDEDSLLRFLNKVFPMLEEELNKPNTNIDSIIPTDDFGETDCFEKIATLNKYDCVHKMVVNRLRWNNDGSSIAASLVYESHFGWCKHTSYLIIYKANVYGEMVSEIEKTVELNTCITDIQYHPKSRNILAVCTKEGKVFIYNFRDRDNVSVVRLDALDDSEYIAQVGWTANNNDVLLVVAGFIGYLKLWKESRFEEGDYKVDRKFNFKTDDGIVQKRIVMFDFSPVNPCYLIVATEGGLLLGCRTENSVSLISDNENENSVLCTLEISTLLAVNCIKFSPSICDLFAASFLNDCVHVYTYSQKAPLQVIYPLCPILGLEWNFDQSNILKMWGIDGNIYFYNSVNVSTVKSVNVSESSLLCSSFFRRRNNQEIVFADSEGDITIWKCPVNVTTN